MQSYGMAQQARPNLNMPNPFMAPAQRHGKQYVHKYFKEKEEDAYNVY